MTDVLNLNTDKAVLPDWQSTHFFPASSNPGTHVIAYWVDFTFGIAAVKQMTICLYSVVFQPLACLLSQYAGGGGGAGWEGEAFIWSDSVFLDGNFQVSGFENRRLNEKWASASFQKDIQDFWKADTVCEFV